MATRRYWRSAVLALPLGLVALAATAARPDFSGEWVLNPARSRFGIAQAGAVDSAVVRIRHEEPRFRFERTFFTAGERDTLTWELTTDGAEVSRQDGATQGTARLAWHGDTLEYATRIATPRGVAGDTVRYTLLDGGRTLQADERFRAPRLRYDNLWVFERR